MISRRRAGRGVVAARPAAASARQVDAVVARTGLDAPPARARRPPAAPWAQDVATPLDLRAAGITTVRWATGFRRDFSWLPAVVLDAAGEPVHDRGVTAMPGLYVVGLGWLYRRSSSFLAGVGADAEHLAEHLAARTAARATDSVTDQLLVPA